MKTDKSWDSRQILKRMRLFVSCLANCIHESIENGTFPDVSLKEANVTLL